MTAHERLQELRCGALVKGNVGLWLTILRQTFVLFIYLIPLSPQEYTGIHTIKKTTSGDGWSGRAQPHLRLTTAENMCICTLKIVLRSHSKFCI